MVHIYSLALETNVGSARVQEITKVQQPPPPLATNQTNIKTINH